jgi:hypothetical protein
MRYLISLVFACIVALPVTAQTALNISSNKKIFNKGDTVIFNCNFYYNEVTLAAATLHVWIENINRSQVWKYRYPLINGKATTALIVDSSMQEGKYAINYLVQPQFTSITGIVNNYQKTMNSMSMLVSSNEGNHSAIVNPDSSGFFKTGKILFTDSATFTFTPINKKGSELNIKIETPIDSGFVPVASYTEVITIGKLPDTGITAYQFDKNHFTNKAIQLNEIIVTADTKAKKLSEFQKQNVSTLYRGVSKDFNGFDNTELLKSQNLFIYLMTQLTGLDIYPYSRGDYVIQHKGIFVDLFLDERPATVLDLQFLPTSDVALIKIFEPGTGPGSRYGGSLAVYTKKGEDAIKIKQRSVFSVFGYNRAYSVWK